MRSGSKTRAASVIRDAAGRITGVDLRASWVTDTDLRKLLSCPISTTLDLSLTRITDQGMQELKNAPGIVDLNLYFAEYVTDEGLAAIKDWKKLKRLNVHGTKISDTTLEHISGITTLESVNVGSAMITDVGIERLVSLPNLKELTMGGNELGDAGLQALRQIPGLTYLDLSGRQGTDSNIWAISISDVGLDAVLTLKESARTALRLHFDRRRNRGRQICHRQRDGRLGPLAGKDEDASETGKAEAAGLQPRERRGDPGTDRIARPARSGPQGDVGHRKRPRRVTRGQAESPDLFRTLGRQSREFPK